MREAAMFIDYVALMLVNMAAGLLVLAAWSWRGPNQPNPKAWAPAFAMVGLVAFLAGLHMSLTWPITHSGRFDLRWANAAWGDLSVLLGVLFLGAALALAKEWNLVPVAVYALIASLVAVVVGIRIMDLGLSKTPILTGVGFLLTAFGGLLVFPIVRWPAVRWPRVLASLSLAAGAAVWLLTAVLAYWSHLEQFSKS
jgi:putative membrane protein